VVAENTFNDLGGELPMQGGFLQAFNPARAINSAQASSAARESDGIGSALMWRFRVLRLNKFMNYRSFLPPSVGFTMLFLRMATSLGFIRA